MPTRTEQVLTDLGLVDHHVHGVIDHDPDRPEFEDLITESAWPAGTGLTFFDTQLGFSLRRLCAPVLDLASGCAPEEYLERRAELGCAEVNRRLLRASGIATYLLETGYRGDDILSPDEFGEVAAARTFEVVRLERVAENLAATGVGAAEFVARYAETLAAAVTDAVGLKSIMAYRNGGLDFDPDRPTLAQAEAAAGEWLAAIAAGAPMRIEHPVLLRFILWAGVDTGLPLQFHVGYGDPDIDLARCNPLHMTEFLRRTRTSGTQFALLHCYPYHREAGYLAHVFPHVYCDVGLGVNYTGSRSDTVLAEAVELTPFHKALFSSDAFGLSELHFLGAKLFRRGLARVFAEFCEHGDWTEPDAARVAELIGRDNAVRLYRLPEGA